MPAGWESVAVRGGRSKGSGKAGKPPTGGGRAGQVRVLTPAWSRNRSKSCARCLTDVGGAEAGPEEATRFKAGSQDSPSSGGNSEPLCSNPQPRGHRCDGDPVPRLPPHRMITSDQWSLALILCEAPTMEPLEIGHKWRSDHSQSRCRIADRLRLRTTVGCRRPLEKARDGTVVALWPGIPSRIDRELMQPGDQFRWPALPRG